MNHESAYMLAINTEKSQAEATCAYRISLRKKRKKKKSQIWCIIRLVNIWIREIYYLDSSHEPLFPLGASVPRFIYGFGGNLEFRRFRLRVASERKEKKIVEHNKTQREKKKSCHTAMNRLRTFSTCTTWSRGKWEVNLHKRESDGQSALWHTDAYVYNLYIAIHKKDEF